MILFQAIGILLHFTLVPVAIGRIITYRSKAEINNNGLVVYFTGLFASWAIFYVLCTLVSCVQNFTHLSTRTPVEHCFTALCVIYLLVLVVLMAQWLYLRVKDQDKIRVKNFIRQSDIREHFKQDKFLIFYVTALTIGIIFQLYHVAFYQINEWSYDDSDYVAISNDNIVNDVISISNYSTGDYPSTVAQRMAVSWTTYISYLAKITGFDVATVCHTILPMILLLVAYLAYYYVAKILFDRPDNRFVFLLMIEIMLSYGLYSHYSISFRTICAIWQGKAVLSAIAVPFFIGYLPQVFSNSAYSWKRAMAPQDKKEEMNIWDYAILLSMTGGVVSLSTMSIILIFAVTGVTWVAMCIYKRGVVGVRQMITLMMGPVVGTLVYFLFMIVENTGRGL